MPTDYFNQHQADVDGMNKTRDKIFERAYVAWNKVQLLQN